VKKEKLWTKDYILILLCVLFASFTTNVFMIIVPTYVLDIGGSDAITGFMMTGLTISGIITRIFFGPLIDRWGRKKTLMLGSSLFALNTLAYCFIKSIPGLFILRIFNGISQGIFFPVPPTIVADVVPKGRLVDGIGFFGATSSLGFAAASFVGLSIYQNYGATMLFALSFLCAAISVIFASLVKDRYVVENEDINTINKKRIQLPKVSMIFEFSILLTSLINFFILFSNSSVSNFLINCGLSRGISKISLFFVVNHIVNIIVRLMTGKIARKINENVLISFGIVCTFLAMVLIAFAHNIYIMLIASILLGIGVTMIQQLIHVKILHGVEENRRGVANSTFQLLGDIGNGVGATVWGNVASYGGYFITFILAAASTLFAGMIHIKQAMRK